MLCCDSPLDVRRKAEDSEASYSSAPAPLAASGDADGEPVLAQPLDPFKGREERTLSAFLVVDQIGVMVEGHAQAELFPMRLPEPHKPFALVDKRLHPAG